MKKILITLILALTIISCEKDKAIPNSIPFKLKGSLPMVTVKINGKNAKLLIDSGAFNSIIDSSSCSDLNFNVYDNNYDDVSGIGGTNNLYGVSKIETYYNGQPMYIRFKSSNIKNLKNVLGVVGIIGGDYFVNHDIIIDYKNRVVRTPTLID